MSKRDELLRRIDKTPPSERGPLIREFIRQDYRHAFFWLAVGALLILAMIAVEVFLPFPGP